MSHPQQQSIREPDNKVAVTPARYQGVPFLLGNVCAASPAGRVAARGFSVQGLRRHLANHPFFCAIEPVMTAHKSCEDMRDAA